MDRILGILSLSCLLGAILMWLVGCMLSIKIARHIKTDKMAFMLLGFPFMYFHLKDVADVSSDIYVVRSFERYRTLVKGFLVFVLGFFVCWFAGIFTMVL